MPNSEIGIQPDACGFGEQSISRSSRVEIVIVIVLEHGFSDVLVGELHGILLSLVRDEFDGLGLVVPAGFESSQGLFEGVLCLLVRVNQALHSDEDLHFVNFLEDLQLDDQSLTEAPASWTKHTEEELSFLSLVWDGAVLDLDWNGQSEVGHAFNHFHWHFDIFDDLGSLQANNLASWLEWIVSVVSELCLDEDRLTWSSDQSALRTFHKSASVELVSTAEWSSMWRSTVWWSAMMAMRSSMRPPTMFWWAPMMLWTTPAPGAATAAAPLFTVALLLLAPGFHLLAEALAPSLHLLGKGLLVPLTVLLTRFWARSGTLELLTNFLHHVAEVELLRCSLFLALCLGDLVFVLGLSGSGGSLSGTDLGRSTLPVMGWTVWRMVWRAMRWVMRWTMSEVVEWWESMRWSVVSMGWQSRFGWNSTLLILSLSLWLA